MQRIIPSIWYDGKAAEASRLYASAFRDAGIVDDTVLKDTPSGDAQLINLVISGQTFSLLSAGSEFRPTPAISFLVTCDSPKEVDALWSALSPGGKVLMPLGSYPFSPRYGWTEDAYGVSWQLYYSGPRGDRPRIIPTFMFSGDGCGKAEEAMRFWASIFADSSIGGIQRYGPGAAPDSADSVQHGEFVLAGQLFSAMDSAADHRFGFTEGLSLMYKCDTQAEIDRIWSALSAHPEAEQCGWIKDKYGVSWQIVPRRLEELMSGGDPERANRVVQAFLKMKKMDIDGLERAYDGR
jgi:predicted 3-demethylubiquinone-9 3-methyltransferase (glyoxalase superfamily)